MKSQSRSRSIKMKINRKLKNLAKMIQKTKKQYQIKKKKANR